MQKSYIIDLWEGGHMIQSVEGHWIEEEARRMTVYYLGYYRADRAQLLRDRRDQIEFDVMKP